MSLWCTSKHSATMGSPLSFARVPATDGRSAPLCRAYDARALALDDAGLRDYVRQQTRDTPLSHHSRSYAYPYAMLASWHDAVGVDIERLQPHDLAFATTICTPRELIEVRLAAHEGDEGVLLSHLWSCKEALAKALGDALRYEPSRLEVIDLLAVGHLGRWIGGSVDVDDRYCAWLCWSDRNELSSTEKLDQ